VNIHVNKAKTRKIIHLSVLLGLLLTGVQAIKAQTISPANPRSQVTNNNGSDQRQSAGQKDTASSTESTDSNKPVALPVSTSNTDGKTDNKDKDKDKKTDAKKSDDSELSPREKALLDRIDKLEQRLAEIEAKTGVKSTADSTQSNSTSN